MSHEALKKAFTDDKYGSNWVAKVKEVCKKQSIKLFFIGSPFGFIEQEPQT
jgi:hypothetical protein